MAEKKVTEPVFSVDELRAHSNALFGVQPEIVTGALFGLSEATKTEAQKRIDNFLKREVK